MLDLVGAFADDIFAQVLQLIDQIKKEEQRQEPQGHQGN